VHLLCAACTAQPPYLSTQHIACHLDSYALAAARLVCRRWSCSFGSCVHCLSILLCASSSQQEQLEEAHEAQPCWFKNAHAHLPSVSHVRITVTSGAAAGWPGVAATGSGNRYLPGSTVALPGQPSNHQQQQPLRQQQQQQQSRSAATSSSLRATSQETSDPSRSSHGVICSQHIASPQLQQQSLLVHGCHAVAGTDAMLLQLCSVLQRLTSLQGLRSLQIAAGEACCACHGAYLLVTTTAHLQLRSATL
jgi:hypothetical protein